MKKISEFDALLNWAIAEVTNTERWQVGNVSEHIIQKLSEQKPLTKTEQEELVNIIRHFRRPLLEGLLHLKLEWHKTYLSINELSNLKVINFPSFINLAKSNNFIDLIMALERGEKLDDKNFIKNLEKIKNKFDIRKMGMPIIVGKDDQPPFFLIDGYTRCSAILLNYRSGIILEKIPFIIGIDKDIDKWCWTSKEMLNTILISIK